MHSHHFKTQSWAKLYMVPAGAPNDLEALLGSCGRILAIEAADAVIVFPYSAFGHPWPLLFVLPLRYLKPHSRPYPDADTFLAAYRPTRLQDLQVGQRVLLGRLPDSNPASVRYVGKAGNLEAITPDGRASVAFYDLANVCLVRVTCPPEALVIQAQGTSQAAG